MNSIIMADTFPTILEIGTLHLSEFPGIETVVTCQTERELKKALAKAVPDILILDLNMIASNASGFCAGLIKKHPSLKILLFTEIANFNLLRKYFRIGIHGYLPHTSSSEQLIKAVRTIAAGNIFIPDFFRTRLAEASLGIESDDSEPLTRREKEILRLIIDEHTTREIAEKLYISIGTAETHRFNIIHKLGVRNTAGLVREGVMKGLYI